MVDVFGYSTKSRNVRIGILHTTKQGQIEVFRGEIQKN